MKKLNFFKKPCLLQMVCTFGRGIIDINSRLGRKKINLMFFTLVAFLLCSMEVSAQDRTFNVGVYKQFLIDNKDISPARLYELYPSGLFKESVTPFALHDVAFLDKIDSVYKLTSAEKSLLLKNGFVVTERQRTETFTNQFRNIYNKDLPVFISTDALLQVFHISYDGILKEVELQFLIPSLNELLTICHSRIMNLDEKYGQNPSMIPMLRDVDVYFTMARKLLDPSIVPYYAENSEVVTELMDLIAKENWSSYKLFSDTCPRDIDFSQFKPRGHYTDQNWPELQNYFRAMMWLGRIELYLATPLSALPCSNEEMNQTVKRQIIDAALIQEISSDTDITGIYNKIEEVISFFVGEQDNVTLNELTELFHETGTTGADAFHINNNIQKFQDILNTKPYADQKILSQILASDAFSPESISPASSFMLFGQRFVIDSYVTGQVVYDQITHQDEKICRLRPSTLDVLFSLGNDASTQILIPELHAWKYSDNLAGLRYLIDQYPEEFWESSLYNMWIYTLKSLNPQPQEENIPEFMQTGAWGMEKMNTQLSSWAELRHDNLLYAKQSYTAGGQCFYPTGYVEPNPVFFKRMKQMAEIAIDKFTQLPEVAVETNSFVDYFKKFYSVCDTLDMIVSKELNNRKLTDKELEFINRLCYAFICGSGGTIVAGWYSDLHYGGQNPLKPDYLVADYHTTPTDCVGNPLGWISHAGTGKVDMMISIANSPENKLCAYVGPVMSYHEYVSTNFLRLTDEEWEQTYLSQSFRPEWVYNYLTDTNGYSINTELKLFSNLEELNKALKADIVISVDKNALTNEPGISVHPNPLAYSAIISLNVPERFRNVHTRLALYDIQGKIIKVLIDDNLSPGHYLTKWDRTDQSGKLVPSGIYLLKLDQGDYSRAIKVLVMD